MTNFPADIQGLGFYDDCSQFVGAEPESLALNTPVLPKRGSPPTPFVSTVFGNISHEDALQRATSDANDTAKFSSQAFGDLQGNEDEYLLSLLQTADNHRQRQGRVRFEDMGMSPRKRSRLTSKIDDIIHDHDRYDDCELIKLQMITIAGLQTEKAELQNIVKRLQDENNRLLEMSDVQTKRRQGLLHSVFQQRAAGYQRQADFLFGLVNEESSGLKRFCA